MDQSTHESWVTRLSGADVEQTEALSELRQTLFGRMQHAFRNNNKVDDSFLEDVVQDGLMVIMRDMGDFEGKSKFTTWCTTITVRIAISELRRQRWKDLSLEKLMEDESSFNDLAATDEKVDTMLQRSQLIETMFQIIAEQLTAKQRLVLEAELKGIPQSEIGNCLGNNRNAVYKMAHDARKKLKRGLIEAGYSIEDLRLVKGADQ